MPRINTTIPIQDGVSVFNYQSGKEGWYVRRWNKAERKYRIKRIEGAETQEQALASFYKPLATFQTTKQKVLKKRSDAATFEELVKEFHEFEDKKVLAGFKDESAAYHRRSSLRHMLDYFETKEIKYPSQITATVFEDYIFFRQQWKKGTIKSEIKDISVFFRQFLVQREQVTNEMILTKNFFPRIVLTDDELDANPAVTPEDYKLINQFIRSDYQNSWTNHRGQYMKRFMWALIHLMKNSGCRPVEMMRLKYKDLTITNPKRWSESKQEWEDNYKVSLHVKKTKTGKKRDVPCSSNAGENLMKFLKFQKQYMNLYTRHEITPDSLVFGRPAHGLEKGYSYAHIHEEWHERIYLKMADKLSGNRFSDRPYTLYSFRTTYIEDRIKEGLDIYLIARLAGNSVPVIQKYYDRHDILQRMEEIQAIDYGKRKKPEPEVINVLEV